MTNLFRRGEEQSGSFLPEDYVAAKGESKANFLAVLLFSIVMFGVISAFLITNRKWEAVKTERQRVEALYVEEAERIDQLKELEKARDEMIRRLQITNILVEKVPRSVLLDELSRLAPEALTFMEIELTSKRIQAAAPKPEPAKRGKVRSLTGKADGPAEPPKPKAPKFEYSLGIVGVAKSNSEIADYLTSLQGSVLLQGVELEYIRSTIEEDRPMRKFKIGAKIPPDADASELAVLDEEGEEIAEDDETTDGEASLSDAADAEQGG